MNDPGSDPSPSILPAFDCWALPAGCRLPLADGCPPQVPYFTSGGGEGRSHTPPDSGSSSQPVARARDRNHIGSLGSQLSIMDRGDRGQGIHYRAFIHQYMNQHRRAGCGRRSVGRRRRQTGGDTIPADKRMIVITSPSWGLWFTLLGEKELLWWDVGTLTLWRKENR